MRIAILAPGLSLTRYSPGLAFDLVIGVNIAACVHRCDWWCAGDWQVVHEKKPIGLPHVCTLEASFDWLYHNRPDLIPPECPRQLVTWMHLRNTYSPPDGFDNYSGPTSLVLAAHLGAREIVTFGMDMAGGKYFDGSTNDNCTETRWTVERPLVARVIAWLASRGVRVTHGNDDANASLRV